MHAHSILRLSGYAMAATFNFSRPPELSNDTLQRTASDISLELTKEEIDLKQLPPISEVGDARCECCGMMEECTPEYTDRVRHKHSGKWVCGLCAEAVKEEMKKNGGRSKEEALSEHMSVCSKFNKFGRAHPVLAQADAMREMLKKDKRRASSSSPREVQGGQNKGAIARSSSCIPAITRDMTDLTLPK